MKNMKKLRPKGGFTDPGFGYFLKLRCLHCDTERAREACYRYDGEAWCSKSIRCRFSGQKGSIYMFPRFSEPNYGQGRTPLMHFICNAVEPVELSPWDEWVAISEDGQLYNMSLDLGEFVDCSKGLSVKIIELSFELVRIALD